MSNSLLKNPKTGKETMAPLRENVWVCQETGLAKYEKDAIAIAVNDTPSQIMEWFSIRANKGETLYCPVFLWYENIFLVPENNDDESQIDWQWSLIFTPDNEVPQIIGTYQTNEYQLALLAFTQEIEKRISERATYESTSHQED